MFSKKLKIKKIEILGLLSRTLPRRLVGRLLLARANFTKASIEGLEFSVASNKKDLEAAYHLLYNCYQKQGYMKENDAHLRVTSFHALPTTSTLIAKLDGEVVATVSIVRAGVFGVPLESSLSIDEIKNDPRKIISEISSLGIHEQLRGKLSEILIPMYKFLYLYGRNYLHTDYFLIGVHPKSFIFYKFLFGFKELSKGVERSYRAVNDAPMVAGFLELSTLQEYLHKTYSNVNKTRDLHYYFFETEDLHFKYPFREFHSSFDCVMNDDLFEYFFIQKTNSLEDLTIKQLKILNDIYGKQHYSFDDSLVDGFGQAKFIRKHFRCPVSFVARFEYSEVSSITTVVSDASIGGFAIYLSETPLKDKKYKITVELSRSLKIDLVAYYIVNKNNGVCGFEIINPCHEWIVAIEKISEGIERFSSAPPSKKVA